MYLNFKNVAFFLSLALFFAFSAYAEQPTNELKNLKKATATIGTDGVQRVEIAGGEYYFEPNYIIVKVNVPTQLDVKKAADASSFIPHNIVVHAPEAGMDFNIDMKKELLPIKFTPTKIGKYPMYCDKKPPLGKSHREKGMEGVVEVVP